ncbi:MAG: Hsp20/alpha crystallin family protein [Betaproteobacteria bacterium]|nr:Hsp20/alpha crystallin family protein [Betaproteobacteria bacterium]
MADKPEKTPAKRQEIVKAEPIHALSPFEEMDRMFDAFLRRGWMRPWRMDWPGIAEVELRMPKVDVIERDTEIVIKAEVPGIDKKDIDVQVTEGAVTIKGSTKHEEKEEKGDFYRCEITRGDFSRTVALPAEVDGSKAKAAFKDGMLELTLPKVEASKRHRVKVD